ncbi:MAG: hypothetical protein RQ724_06255, partial [Desulfuromonadales bacterium]|nr:hypothetical protein [Desulfuromonadales bacterium]
MFNSSLVKSSDFYVMNAQKTDLKRGRGAMGKNKYASWTISFMMLIGLCVSFSVLMASNAYALEMVTNGTFNASASWTFTTATYDGTNTATADGSGSGTVSASGRNTLATGTITQTVAIASGCSIASAADVIAAVKHTSTAVASASRAVTIDLRYADATTVQIFYNNTFADGITWTSIPNQTATVFPLTLAQNVDQIIVTLETKDGNNGSAASQLWADEVSITYTSPCTDTDVATMTISDPVESATLGGLYTVYGQVGVETAPLT